MEDAKTEINKMNKFDEKTFMQIKYKQENYGKMYFLLRICKRKNYCPNLMKLEKYLTIYQKN